MKVIKIQDTKLELKQHNNKKKLYSNNRDLQHK